MFRKILLSTDLSVYSDSLITCITEIKNLGLEEIILAHVSYIASTPVIGDLKQDARALLERQATELQSNGFRITVELPSGLPAPTLASTADKYDVSLVVVGSHGRGILKETVLYHLARRPILVFPADFLAGPEGTRCRRLFDHILLATDFSETAENILPYVSRISAVMSSMVTIVHVLEKNVTSQEEEGKRFLIEAKRERLQRQGAKKVAIDLCHGDPGREICKMAAGGNFSLVFMGSTKTGIVKDVVLGSSIKEVIHHCGVPVVIVPSDCQVKNSG